MKKGILKSNKGGFIQITLIIVGVLVILKYAYSIDIVGYLTEGKFKDFLDTIYGLGNRAWGNYNETVREIWNKIKDLVKKFVSEKVEE